MLTESFAMHDKITHIFSQRSMHWLIFIIIGAVLYGFTLNYPFVFDDRFFLIKNPLIKDPEMFLELLDIDEFLSDYMPRLSHPELATSFASRPIAYLSFSLNYLFGGKSPVFYRLFNIAVHISNAIMLYQLLLSIIRRRSDEIGSYRYLTIPLFAALIFLVHPLQTQSVTYITQRFTSLGTFFYLATMLLYLRSSSVDSAVVRGCAYAASIVAMILGLLTKEIVLTVPIALVMVDTILLHKPLRKTLIRLSPHIAGMSLTPLILLNLANEIDNNQNLFTSATDIVGGIYSRSEYAITQLRAILSYFRLLVLPYNQNFDPDYPLYRSLYHPEIIISILIWVAFIVAGVRLLRRHERNICTDLTGFSIFWFPLSISVSSSFIPMSDLMFEHHSYLPSIAFCTGIVAYLHHVVNIDSIFRRNAVIVGLCMVSLIFGALTIKRNHIFSSRISIWSDTLKKSPNKFRPHYAVGKAFYRLGKYDQAILHFVRSLALNPDYVEPYVAIGAIYLDLEMPQSAIELYENYLASHQPEPRILMNLSLAYMTSGRLQQAIDTVKLALKIKNDDVKMLSLLAELNLYAGKIQRAQLRLAQAREVDINDPTIDMTSLHNRIQGMIQGAIDRGDVTSS